MSTFAKGNLFSLFFGDPFFLDPLFSFFLFFLSPAKVGSLEMQPGAKLQAYLGVIILQPHARILRRTRSMLDGRVLEASQVEYEPFGKPPLKRDGRVCLASPVSRRARAPPAPAPSSRPCTCSSARRRPRNKRCGAPSAPGRSCPPGRPARASGRLRHTQNSRTSSAEMPRRLQSWRSMASKSAHLLHAQLQQLGQLPGHAQRLVLEGALQHVLLAGQLEAHAPQAPHALAQERLHLGPGVPVACSGC